MATTARGYGYDQPLQRRMAWEPYTPYRIKAPPLQAEEEGPPT
jgi:hypothetical protein